MSAEVFAPPSAGRRYLRAGAALALVLAAASLSPAIAHKAPEPETPKSETPKSDTPKSGTPKSDTPKPETPESETPKSAALHTETLETSAAAGDDQAPRDSDAQPGSQRDRVYVMGRRVGSSLATADLESATQVVNVISGETLQEQGVASLEQALRNVPGITTQIGEGGVMSGDQFFIRGLSAKNDAFTDGLRDFGVYTRDSFNYGQVEVFKGPSASAFGRGAAGGGINTSSKTPFTQTAGSASVAAGSASYARFIGDWNQDLGAGMAARIAVMTHHNEVEGRDHIYSDRWGVAPSIGFGLDGDTTATIAYLHQDEEKAPDYGIPTLAPTANDYAAPSAEYGVRPSNFYGFNADIDATVVDALTARLRHVVNDWLTLASDFRYGYYQRYSQFTPATCPTPSLAAPVTCAVLASDGDPATIPLASLGGPGPYEQDTSGVQNITTAAITAPVGGLKNELLVGLDASWQQNDRNQYAYATRVATRDLLNPGPVADPTLSPVLNNIRDTRAKDVSVFLNDRLWFNGQWSLTAGLRAAWYEVDQEQTGAGLFCRGVAGYSCFSSNTDFLTPQVGVIWTPSESQFYYLSYSTSARPTGVSVGNGDTVTAANDALDPEENASIEAGARIGLFGERLQVQGALFQTRKENAKEFDATGAEIARSGDSQEITGLELGLGGAITDQWSLTANYTWLDAVTTDTTASYTFRGVTQLATGNHIVFTPEHAASVWTTYNFTGELAGLEIGGGATYQDNVFLNVQNTATAPGYATLDGFISYGFDRFRISLNGYNLSDQLYYSQVHGNRVTPGPRRTLIATLGVVY